MVYHGLIQAFSRTNRILNSVKQFGNIVCFRDLESELNEALSLFGSANKAKSVVLLKTYKDYYNGYDIDGESFVGYVNLVSELKDRYPLGDDIVGEKNKKEFIKLYSQILRVRNILTCFDEFAGDTLLTSRELQDYQSIYIEIYSEYRDATKTDDKKEDIADDIEFEIELIKQITVNIDYILELIEKYSKNIKDKEVVVDIEKALDSSLELRGKKELIMDFITTINPSSDVRGEFIKFTNKKKLEELNRIIEEENLDRDKTLTFIKRAYKNAIVEF
ncbi:hypothetical protein KDD93_08635 [Campylobacter sp. faydin G-24]|uniref:Uncharacterized protein n=1 Tax=Campylobacter anatolicus TaxID=2829105 RepID=A0ABS5HKF0_9BACT|nr:hypothetical protein [Campylobacter anatolicus]MBR8464623.1 hypothetical protein [Campylobacter anatolicus]